MSKPADQPKRRRRLPRWSMRAMFIGVTIVCLAMGLVVRPAEQRKRAVAALRELSVISAYNYLDVSIIYDFEIEHEVAFRPSSQLVGMRMPPVPESSKPGPAWLRVMIGIDYFADVEQISLAGPQFRDHDLRHLRHFSKLDSLSLWECESITEVGVEHLTRLTTLTDLLLHDSPITTLPPEIGRLTNLTDLDLGENQLAVLPPEFGQLTKLTYINLADNQLTALPPEIGKLTKLVDLYLEGNRLTTLPPEIQNLKALRDLLLDYNQLAELPTEIGELRELIRLALDENQLTELPPEIGKLTKLVVLDLENNQIPKLPPEIDNLTKLARLELGGNPITDADLVHLKSLKNLESVGLRETKVTKEGVADLKRALPNCEIKSDF